MARLVRDSNLETRAARDRLKANPKPYFRTIIPHQVHLGYRKTKPGLPGWWLVRRYIPKESGETGSPYQSETLSIADDFQDSDGTAILDFAQAQKLALARANVAHERRGSLTMADAIADYIKYLTLERKTASDTELRARTLILPALGKIKVADLTTEQITRWRDALAQQPARLRTAKPREGEKQPKQNYKAAPKGEKELRARKATVNRTLVILRAALNRQFHMGTVHDNLAWRRVKPFDDVQVARQEFLTLAEAKRLINAADKKSGFRDLVQGALLTGCRYGELCRAQVRNFKRGKLTIPTSKSGHARDVSLTAEGVKFFSQMTAGRAGNELIFRRFRRTDVSQWKTSAQARPMQTACERAGIPALGFHQLRHTWASLALTSKPPVPMLVVAHNLGHKDSRMVELHYGHLTEKYIEEQIRAGAPTFDIVMDEDVVSMGER